MYRTFCGFTLMCLVGCGGTAKPRSTDEIFTEKQNMPRLYLSKTSHARVIAPKTKGTFKHETNGEDMWPALECTNPDCPGRKDNEPALFLCFDLSAHHGCPECAKKRKYAAETAEQKQKYLAFVQMYELPEVRERLKKLDEEYKIASQRPRGAN